MLDCAIIGAGLAGLVAAQHLADRGLKVVVLEARDRVGGRVENKTLSDGSYVELGGQWIGPGFDALLEIIDGLGLETIGLPAAGNLAIRLRGKSLSVPSSEDGRTLTPFEVSDLGQGLLRLRRLAKRLRDDPAWRKANDAWLGQDLRRWVSTNLRTEGAQRRFAEVYQAAFGAMPKGATLLGGLHQVNSGPDLESMLASNGGLHQKRVAGGMAAVADALAEKLGGVVRLGKEVVRVEHDDASARIILADGEVIEAKQVISTLPPRLAVALPHEPALPDWRAEAADKVSAGNVIKAFLIYERPFWRELGLSGQSSADEGAVRVTFDTTAGDSERGHLMGFFEGADAASLARRSSTLRERAFVDSVVRTFGEVARNPVTYIERDWASEKFTGGCHGAHFAPGVWTTQGPVLARPEGVLHWAGAEYASRFNGYLEGAVRSGREVAAAVARNLA
ncbi:flavin monoamine oxidase family protein [Tessaracoccus flavus]|uniref:Amine oxidase n=1 Tax=Tessaracoccus flavus TaxID=1610493 RepID=A0A1Q2CC26_9ACTN|nr:NAD(P)/FAD-dependent oxidoreductase [Tessaracoccus flavus]AQP43650.1 amine oxidase [Tessaracoccus flavus]SDZ01844.1 UDP-galactopyranose mutase [Tessaracoccus flavus]